MSNSEPQTGKNTGKSLGSRFQHEIFYFMIRLRLVFVAKIVLRFVVFYYAMLPAVRKRSYPYLKRRFPRAQGFAMFIHCYKLYLCFAEGLLERIIVGILGERGITKTSEAREYIKNNLPIDKGCIVLTAHIGAWQLGLAGIEELNKTVNIVQWIHDEDSDKHYFQHKEQQGKHSIQLINSRHGIDASFAITSALQRKEIVCIAGDRITVPTDNGVAVDFLGGKIHLPATAFLLASITQVPLIMSFSILTKQGVKGIKTEILNMPRNLRRNPQELQQYAQYFANTMEDMVEKYPYHFFNFFDMWDINNDSSRV